LHFPNPLDWQFPVDITKSLQLRRVLALASVLFAVGFPAALLAEGQPERTDRQTESNATQERRRLVAEYLPLTPTEAHLFWPIYELFMKETAQLVDRRQAIVARLGENFDEMTDEVAMELTKETIEYQEARLKLLKTFLPKYEKVIPPKKLARYYQIESRIRAAVDVEIAKRIPLIK
jgi:hypothetical protein